MKIDVDDSKIFYEGIVDEELALVCLLADGICFLNNIEFTKGEGYTTCIFVNLNDVFAWGCADAENLSNNDWQEPSEIIDLYRHWKKNDKWGHVIWAAFKRKEQPQDPMKERMIKDGVWTPELEALPENRYWKYIREKNK